MSRTRGALIGAGAFAAMVAACGGDAGPADAPAGPTANPVHIVTSGLAEPSARQLEMIADGEVTFAEYEEAFFAYHQCVLEAGIRVIDGPTLDVHGLRYSARYGLGATQEEAQRNGEVTATCQDRHLLSVLGLWSDATAPSEALLQEASEFARDCFRADGIEMPAHLTVEDFVTLLAAASSGETAGIPARLSLDDLGPLLDEGALDPSGAVLFTVVRCLEAAGQQFPVGW